MKAIRISFIVLTAILLICLVISLFLPSKFILERETVIKAKPNIIFQEINSMESFNKYSPWYKLDTNAIYKYEGSKSGLGSIIRWESQKEKLGKGSIKIIESVNDRKVGLEISFMEDKSKANAIWTLSDLGAETKVTWTFEMDMGMNLVGRYFGLFMKHSIEKDFTDGLANLKTYIDVLPKDSTKILLK